MYDSGLQLLDAGGDLSSSEKSAVKELKDQTLSFRSLSADFQEEDRSYPAQVVAAQIRTLLYKHEGCTSSVPSPRLKSYFVSFGT